MLHNSLYHEFEHAQQEPANLCFHCHSSFATLSKEHGHAAEHGRLDHGDCLERTMAELDPEEVRQEHEEETSSLCEETAGHEKAEKVAESEERLSCEDRGSEASLVALPEAAGAQVPSDLEVQGCEESRSSPPAGSCQIQAGDAHVLEMCQHGSNRLVVTRAVMVQNIRLPILPRREACMLVLLEINRKKVV